MFGKEVGKDMSQGPDAEAKLDEEVIPSPEFKGDNVSCVELLLATLSAATFEFLGRKRRCRASCLFHPATLRIPSKAQ